MDVKIKKICVKLFACFFSVLVFWSGSSGAATLEVSYPPIAGQTLSAGSTLPEYIVYVFRFAIIASFFIVFATFIFAGALYIISPAKIEARTIAKERVYGSISGLLILLLLYLILITVNPQLTQLLWGGGPPSPPPPPAPTKPLGVYFYKNMADCNQQKDAVQFSVSNIEKFTNEAKDIKVVGLQKDTVNGIYYISVLYSKPGLSGKCRYINPTETCADLGSSFALSASIHKYDYEPDGDGVYFYREACFNKIWQEGTFVSLDTLKNFCNQNSGGYFHVTNDKIISQGVYFESLDNMWFTNENGDCTVPEEKQNCEQFDEDGTCAQRICPKLNGGNITSLIIKGDYIVVFMYAGKNITGINTQTLDSCQEFPTDANKIGPQQIKWEDIRNMSGVIPNYVMIVPFQK